MPGGQNLPYIYKNPERYNTFDCGAQFVQTEQGYAGFEQKHSMQIYGEEFVKEPKK